MPKITFTAKDEYFWNVAPKPIPMKKILPDWWKEMTSYEVTPDNPNGKKLIVENHHSNATFKKCRPMLDALSNGYVITLWSDVQIRTVNNSPYITWRVKGKNVFEMHGQSFHNIETPDGYYSQVFKFINGWMPRTPKGYSYLLVSPLGYRNLPFKAVPAIIDSDKSPKATLEILPPVWVKKDFEGVVEKGTPMVQIIPFKRENWNSEFNYLKDGEYDMIEDKNFNSTIVNHYIKNHWTKKDFK